MQKLSKRLSLAASFVKRGSKVCDVGTDHGYLPLFLYKEGRVESVCATDINEKPLENAKRTFMAEGACEIPLYLCDGLEKIDRNIADTVIIAGMGGEVISGIIDRASFVKDGSVSLILQPMTAARELRIYLSENGFFVEREEAVEDGGRVYSVMLARYDGVSRKTDALTERIGVIKPDTKDNLAYIKRQKRLCGELCSSIENIEEKTELYKRESEALKKLEETVGREEKQ